MAQNKIFAEHRQHFVGEDMNLVEFHIFLLVDICDDLQIILEHVHVEKNVHISQNLSRSVFQNMLKKRRIR